jgi:hypothetical protein
MGHNQGCSPFYFSCQLSVVSRQLSVVSCQLFHLSLSPSTSFPFHLLLRHKLCLVFVGYFPSD